MQATMQQAISQIMMLIFSLILFTFITKKLWSYLVMRLFPGAVEQNLIVKDISWKIALIFAIIFIMIVQNS